MDNWFVYASYVFGGLLVTLYAFSAFNDPEYTFVEEEGKDNYWKKAKPGLPKYMTERSRYRMVSSLFVLFSIAQYLVLAQLLPIIPGIEAVLTITGGNTALVAAGMPIISALLLLGLVRYIEWPRKLLFDIVKGCLHDFANIPDMGRNVFESLCYEPIDYESVETQKKIEKLLKKNYIDDKKPREDLVESDFKVGNHKSIIWKWARLSYGINIIEEWSNDPVFNSQIKEASLGWLALRQAYIDNIDDIIEHREGKLDGDQQIKLDDKIEELLANCHRLMACLVIMVAKSTEDPLIYVRNAGYLVIPGNRFDVRRGEIFRVMVMIIPAIVLVAISYTLIPLMGGEANIPQWGIFVKNVLNYILSAIIILALPVVLVLAVKRYMSMKRTWRTVTRNDPYNSFYDMRLGLYSLLAFISWSLSTVLMMVSHNPSKLGSSIVMWKMMAVYCFISAITAFFAAYRVDIPPIVYPNRLSLILGRSKVAFVQAILTAVTVWAGMVMFPVPDPYAVWKFPIMGFVVAMVLNLTLFYGKHTFERRSISRNYLNEPMTAVIEGFPVEATLISESIGGASLKLNRNHILPKGTKIELIMANSSRLFGQVVGIGANELHISYLQT